MTALHQGDRLGHITPTPSMSLSEVHTSSRSGRRMHQNLSLKGSLSLIWISCSIALMQPSSFPSSVKMLWMAKTSFLVVAAFLWGPVTDIGPTIPASQTSTGYMSHLHLDQRFKYQLVQTCGGKAFLIPLPPPVTSTTGCLTHHGVPI